MASKFAVLSVDNGQQFITLVGVHQVAHIVIILQIKRIGLLKRMSEKEEPKVKLSFDGCYNYDRLKKEGLINDEKKEDIKEYTPENDPFGGY